MEVPVIKNIIFIKATKQNACDLPNRYNIPIFYMKNLLTRALLVVPDKQMEDFMFVMNLDPDRVGFNDESLLPGSKVRVVKGPFCGVEGELAVTVNRTYVVIRMEGVLSASIRVPKSYLCAIK